MTARTGETHVRVDLAERVLVDLARARRLALDVVRHRRAAEGGRRGGRRARARPSREPPRQPARPRRLRRRARRRRSRRGRAAPGCSGCCSRSGASPVLEGGGATSLGAALGLVSRLARQRSLVAIVSDFRGPRDWRPPLLQLAGGHDVLAVEIRDPREETLPNVGELRLVDPETGRQLRVDTAQPPAARALRRRRGRRARRGRARAHLARRRPRRPLDRGRLAAAARSLPAPAGSATVSFAWPLALLVAARRAARASPATSLLERRRRRGRPALFASPALVPNLVGRRPGRLRHLPPALALLALAAARDRPRAPARDAVGQARGGDGRARDRHLPLDGRDGRRSRPGSRPRKQAVRTLPRQAARRATASAMVSFAQTRARRRCPRPRTARPRKRALRNLRPATARRSARGSRAPSRSRSASATEERQDGRRPRSSSSPTARRPRACSSRCRRRSARRRLKIPVYTVALGTPNGRRRGARRRRLHAARDRAAGPADAAAGRAGDRRPLLRRARRRAR